MNRPTISDQDLASALRAAGHPATEITRVLNERRAWLKYRADLRDAFAKAALPQLYIALRDLVAKRGQVDDIYDLAARAAYEQADAMLRVRQLPNPGEFATLTEH